MPAIINNRRSVLDGTIRPITGRPSIIVIARTFNAATSNVISTDNYSYSVNFE